MSVVVPQPAIAPIGPFRVMLRTDGRYIVVDERLPLGANPVWIGRGEEGAKLALERIASGAPT